MERRRFIGGRGAATRAALCALATALAAPGSAAAPSAPLPEPEVAPSGAPQSWREYRFVPPPGWTAGSYPEGVLLQAPGNSPAALAWIALLPLRRAEADPWRQAVDIARAHFGARVPGFLSYGYGGENLLDTIERGVTAEGWPFLEVNLTPRADWGGASGHLVRVLAIRIGDQLAPVLAYDSRQLLDDAGGWGLFWHGLSFPGHKGPGPAALEAQVAGRWGYFTSGGLSEETFGPDGSYDSSVAVRTYRELSRTEVLERTQAWFGEGRYQVRGSRLATWPRGGKPSTALFRISEQANRSAPGGWLPVIRRLGRGLFDGRVYEAKSTRKPPGQ